MTDDWVPLGGRGLMEAQNVNEIKVDLDAMKSFDDYYAEIADFLDKYRRFEEFCEERDSA